MIEFLYDCLTFKLYIFLSFPLADEATERPGYLRSFWSWITSWWSSEETVQPVTEPLIQSTTSDPNSVGVNVTQITIWCNDQTCTTMKCDKIQCRNITCSLYDTDFRGECREYNAITEPNNNDIQSTEATSSTTDSGVQSKPINTPSADNSPAVNAPADSETGAVVDVAVDEQPEQPPIENVQNVTPENIQVSSD